MMQPEGHSTKHYDAIIIGAGQSGGPLASALAHAGWKTALVEEKYAGGTCINFGCTPTKTMVASAQVAYMLSRAADFGVHAGPIRIELPEIVQRKEGIVSSFREGSYNRIVNSGVEYLQGHARFSEPFELEITFDDGKIQKISSEKIFINAGSRPGVPEIKGLDSVPYLNSTTIMELQQVPPHLLILGGGYVSMEFGQMFRRFGSQVTILQRSSQLLPREDVDVSDAVQRIFEQDGIEVQLGADTTMVEKTQNGEIWLTVNTPRGQRTFAGSHLLVAVGRVPNSDGLNLQAAGIEVDKRGFIKVNHRLDTNVPGIYALGDINGGPIFTHISYDDFRILKMNLIDHGNASTEDRLVPYTLFIDPQLGRIGMTEREASRLGKEILVAKMGMDGVARAVEVGETRGMMKAVIDKDSQQILGAAILGKEGGELMAMIEIAMLGKIPYPVLRDAVFAHPTLSESLNNLFNVSPG